MTTKHTPGPWVHRPGQTDGHWIIGLPNDIPECIGLRGDEYMCVSGICTEPDARLIAAAPELLEALQALVSDAEDAEVFSRQQGFHDIAAERRGRINAAFAAIAKAKGEQA